MLCRFDHLAAASLSPIGEVKKAAPELSNLHNYERGEAIQCYPIDKIT